PFTSDSSSLRHSLFLLGRTSFNDVSSLHICLAESVINISVGGIGILTKEMDFEPLFQVGMNAELSFQFGTLPVNTPITLRYLQKVQSTLIGKRLRIGVQFEGIPQKSQDEIHIYVMNESVKFLGRKP
ncbi:MAG: PilZ domain-containing protein, partial [Proteobacteria bacterium]